MTRVTATAALVLLAGSVQAAPSPGSLLREVEQAQARSARINQQRVQRFLASKQKQEQLLQQARARLAPVLERTETLRARYDTLQSRIAALQKKLDERAGGLEQMGSVVGQAAANLLAVARDSIIAAQYPRRLDRLQALAGGRGVPSAADLKALWYQLQLEMTATGRVTTFPAPVIAPDGTTSTQQVTRVGPFVAVSDGAYLQYLPGVGLKRLPRQPGAHARAMAAHLAAAQAGLVRMVIDPTRGGILALLKERATLVERIRQGGGIGYLTIALGLLGLAIASVQLLRLLGIGARVRWQLRKIESPREGNPLGRVLIAGRDADPEDPEGLELKLDEAVLREVPSLQRGQPLIKLLAAVAPMLGLLGTVVGMIATFQTITLFGTSDPKLMADGISKALVTTVLGLVVAIPLMFAHSLLAARSRGVVQILEQQSAGLLARYLERGDDRGRA